MYTYTIKKSTFHLGTSGGLCNLTQVSNWHLFQQLAVKENMQDLYSFPTNRKLVSEIQRYKYMMDFEQTFLLIAVKFNITCHRCTLFVVLSSVVIDQKAIKNRPSDNSSR